MFLGKPLNSKKTLLFHLTLIYSAIFIFSTAIAYGLFYSRIYSVTMNRLDEELVASVKENTRIFKMGGDPAVARSILSEVKPEEYQEEFVRLMTFSGDVIVQTDMAQWPDVPLMKEPPDNGDCFTTLKRPNGAYDARLYTAVIGPDRIMQLGETLEEAGAHLGLFRKFFIGLFMVLAFTSLFIGWFLAKGALRDMASVTQTAENISKGDFSQRVDLSGQYREIQRLGATFNKMLDKIQALLSSMKEINDNIAHDLRSPLARIRGYAERVLTTDCSTEAYREMAVNAMDESDRLIEMINTMLEITETEAGASKPNQAVFDLAGLVREACDLFQPLAIEKEVVLTIGLPRQIMFSGDLKKMQRIITNLLENAIKYTPPGGRVDISGNYQNGNVTIYFKDNGIGIPKNELPHIFDRFYRCDHSRSEDGVGLGLSLARAYAGVMNGKIEVQSREKRGSTFSLIFLTVEKAPA